MRYQLELFFTALGYFTRLPIPAWVPYSADRLNHAARYFPLIGWIVGAAGAAVFWFARQWLPSSLSVILAMAATIRLTGAFHEDGWADACDGLGGGWKKAQVLEIMKDSRIGTYGTVGLVLMLLAKAAALVEIAAHGVPIAIITMIVAHALSRFASTSLIHTLAYVREDDSSKSRPLAKKLTQLELLIAAAGGLLPLFLLQPIEALGACVAVAIVTFWAARMFVRRLGGYTGDCLGAVQQIAELATYLGILIAWNSI